MPRKYTKKIKPVLRVDRYEVMYREESDHMFPEKTVPIWYIKDMLKGKYGTIVAKVYNEVLARMALEYWNHKKKIRKRVIK